MSMEKLHFSELMEDRYHQNQEAETIMQENCHQTTKTKKEKILKAVRKKSINFKGKMISITSNFSAAPTEIEDQNNIVKVPRGNKCQISFI